MKKFRIGFLAFVAIAAIALTAASNPKVMNSIVEPDQVICRQAQDYVAVNYNLGSGGTQTVAVDDPCPETTTFCVNFLNGTQPTENIVCPIGTDLVCCITRPIPANCTSTPLTPHRLNIICKVDDTK